ncbi:hypothetical protein MAP00_002838 [Monascus purpureus]|nr:hypothetical protein MAP00_002838 [Monascus purpureus]
MAQREQIYISSWPPIWPTRVPAASASQSPGPPNYDNVLANRLRTAAHCFEAKAFGMMCSSYLDQEGIDAVIAGPSSPDVIENALDNASQGASMLLDPTGIHCASFMIHEKIKAQKPTNSCRVKKVSSMQISISAVASKESSIMTLLKDIKDFNRSRRDPVAFTESCHIQE